MSIEYGKIIKDAWKLSWTNKWLWVYGLILAAFGGSSGSNYPPTLNFKSPAPTNNSPPSREVLGAATTAVWTWFAQVSPATWILLALGILILTVIALAVGLVVRNWAKGGLIYAINRAVALQPFTLATTAPRGFVHLKNLILLSFIHSGIIILSCLFLHLTQLPVFLLFSHPPPVVGIIAAVIPVVGFLAWLIFLVLTGFVGIFADRLIVLHNFSPWAAWKQGFHLSRRRFFPTLYLGMIANSLGCSLGCAGLLLLLLIFGLPVFLLLRPSFVSGFHLPGPAQIIPSVLLVLIGLHFQLVVTAFLAVFRYSTWNLFVRDTLAEELSL